MEFLQFGGEVISIGVDDLDGQRRRPNLSPTFRLHFCLRRGVRKSRARWMALETES